RLLLLPEGALLPCELLPAEQGSRCFFCLLSSSRSAGKHTFRTEVNVNQLNAVFREDKLPNLVGVRHAARLQDPYAAIAFSVAFDVAQQNPGIHQRRYTDLRLLESASPLRQAGEKGGDLMRLKKIDQAAQHRFQFQRLA